MSDVNVILVEDDADLRDSLVEMLELSGFYTDGSGSAQEFYQALNTVRFDVAVVDLGLPDQSGLKIVEFLRDKTNMGIIILTARTSLNDRILGYDCGADHFFSKPVDNLELIAAIRNLHSRLVGVQPNIEEALECWRLNKSSWRLACPDGRDVEITSKELVFLDALMQQSNENVTRQYVMDVLGYSHDMYGSRSLDSLIKRLRKKVESTLDIELPIRTVHAVGFCFSAPSHILAIESR
mgnify:CR=1 FL=1